MACCIDSNTVEVSPSDNLEFGFKADDDDDDEANDEVDPDPRVDASIDAGRRTNWVVTGERG